MKIKLDVVKNKDKIIGYRADFTELPGTPKVGTGVTKEDTIASLFIRNYSNLSKLDMYTLEINNIPYKDYINFEDR